MKIILSKLHTPKWLFFLLLAVFILRIPSFFEPYSYGDEMIYLTLGEAIRQNIPLYGGVHDNKPPLLYVIAAVAGSLFWFKAILAIWHIITIFIFWHLGKVLFPKNKRVQIASTVIFALLTTIPSLEGNIANAELFMIGPTMMGFYILLKYKHRFRNLFFAGVAFSIAALFKVPSISDIPAIVFYWLIAQKINRVNLIKITKKTAFLITGLLTPILITFVWYFFRGALEEYVTAAFLQNVGYLSTWRPSDVQLSFFERNSPLLARCIITTFAIIILFVKRRNLSKQFIFLCAWLILSLFAVTLSERPYPHYLIQSIPAVSFLFSMLLFNKTTEQALTVIPLTVFFLVPVYFNFWHYSTTTYYTRFFNFATGKITKDEYFSKFGKNVVRNYKISSFIISTTKKDDKVFVSGDSSAIYALSRRLPPIKYVAGYHIKDFSSDEETVKALRESMPRIIVLLPDATFSPRLTNFVRSHYAKVEVIDGAQIWNLVFLENDFTFAPK